MKEKFREFFEKHRHLIVISLIIAMILAATTPLLIPLGLRLGLSVPLRSFPELKAEDIFGITVACEEHNNLEQRYFQISFNDKRSLSQEDVQAFCTMFNEAPTEQCRQEGGERLCSVSVHWVQTPKGVDAITGAAYTLLHYPDGRYSLYGAAHYGTKENWYISEASARAILACRRCEAEPDSLENPREWVCNTEDVVSATLYTWADWEQAGSVELTQGQIEAFCAFLEEELLPAQCAQKGYPSVRHGKNGWQVVLTKQSGATWYVQYNVTQGGLSLALKYAKGEKPPNSVGYVCADEAVIAALPELLEEVP